MIQAIEAGYRVAGREIVSGVSLSIEPGELVVVAGPNGAGKSTLVRLLSGEIAANSGEVRLLGRPLGAWGLDDLARRRAVLPQSDGIRFALTSREVVALGRMPWRREPAGRNAETVDRAMRAAGAEGLADRSFLTLSGGERRRVHLARVLAQLDPWRPATEPRFLFLDEPVAGLDPSHQHRVLEWARDLARLGVGVVVVLHDLNLAAAYAHRVLLLRAGRLVAFDTPERVLTAPLVRDVFGWTVRVMAHPCRDCPLLVPELAFADNAVLETIGLQ